MFEEIKKVHKGREESKSPIGKLKENKQVVETMMVDEYIHDRINYLKTFTSKELICSLIQRLRDNGARDCAIVYLVDLLLSENLK